MVTFLKLGRYGRLGNMLFQVASVIGIARKNGHNFSFPKLINYDHKERFGSAEEIELYKFFENDLPEVPDIPFEERFVHWGFHDVVIQNNKSVSLEGHMQSDKYFLHCIDEVRHYLKMVDEYGFMKDTCAIHYRAGDYEDNANAYHPRCCYEYYQKAMELLPANTSFIVFSDDIETAKKMFGNKHDYASNNYIDDFKLMKACNHFICANSSYSVMPAILSEATDKIVICPKKWFGAVAGLSSEDCYPQNSIMI